MTFSSLRNFHVHQKTHNENCYKYDQNLYICNTCSAEFQKEEEAKEHIKTHEAVFQCSECKNKFQTLYHYGVHLADHSEDNLFRCPQCNNYKTNIRTNLLIHINCVHFKKFGYVCKKCGRGFKSPQLFKEHENEHLGLRPFVCIVCNRNFTYSTSLTIHQTRCHYVRIAGQLLPNQCSLCRKVFGKTATLEKHREERHPEVKLPEPKKYLCDLCGKGFARKNNLDGHYRIHTGEKPFACFVCSKIFSDKSSLNGHRKVHTGVKPFTCKQCGESFNRSPQLTIHLRKHSGERPYVCSVCTASYTSRGALTMHKKLCSWSIKAKEIE